MKPSASRVSVIARERWERKGRVFFVIQEYQLSVCATPCWICLWIFLTLH